MLRITTDIAERPITFILRLTGIWVSELDRCWHTIRATRSSQPICIDMKALTFVDAAGKALLRDCTNVAPNSWRPDAS
jgi:anti-anti-sigma regulatory factor